MARTAVIAGTATATANAVNRRQAQKNVAAYGAAQEQYAHEHDASSTVVMGASAPAPGGSAVVMGAGAEPQGASMDDKLAQLERLAQLKAQGILSEDEFAAQKSVILGA